MRVASVALAFLLAIPAVLGHVDDVPLRQVWSFGNFIADLEPEGVPYAEAPANWTLALLLGAGPFRPSTGTIVTITLRQGDATILANVTAVGEHGRWRATWMAPTAGTWAATVDIRGAQRVTGTINDTVYPDLGYRILGSAGAAMTNTTNRIAFWTNPAGRDVVGLALDVERWTEAGQRRLGSMPATLVKDDAGSWHANIEFPEPGLYYLVLASGDFSEGQMPLQRMEVAAGPASGPLDANGWLVLAVMALVVAWLGAAGRRQV